MTTTLPKGTAMDKTAAATRHGRTHRSTVARRPWLRTTLPALPALALGSAAALALVTGGCVVGPRYERPTAPTAAAYKETEAKSSDGTVWKVAQPQDTDAALRGKWWEAYGVPELNDLEQQVEKSNQSLAAALHSFEAARAMVAEARSQYFPTVTTAPAVTTGRQPVVQQTNGTTAGTAAGARVTTYTLPIDATWSPDLWGRVRNTVAGNVAAAQASAADLANTRLSLQAELAADYFQLRGEDSMKELLDSTVVAYRQSLELTRALYETGIDSDEAVAQAETQLEATEAQDVGVGITRAQLEHAISVLVGQPASSFSLPSQALKPNPPEIPVSVPSTLLERRPDIAANERLVAQANAQIGVAQAAYFPTLTLTGGAGFEASRLASWLTWPSRFWSIGASLAETLFDAGLRKATVAQYRAQWEEAVANYRQTALTAFQQVEDNLASVRLLAQEVAKQDAAVKSAQRQLTVATDRYKLGIDPYLNVITAQTTVLSNQQTALNLRIQEMTSSVQLIEALGGGWQDTQLPSPTDLALGKQPNDPAGAGTGAGTPPPPGGNGTH
jgi:NodT family efflux transporter outer membrane factor (OMF) lipoprotein